MLFRSLQLVALLKAHNIKKIVLCPGSRNTPIIQTLANHPFFSCYPVTDERSAAYFALGLALHGGKPAAVCCTSGTALANMHPAVAEAFYQQVPLVVISADRPAAWIGQTIFCCICACLNVIHLCNANAAGFAAISTFYKYFCISTGIGIGRYVLDDYQISAPSQTFHIGASLMYLPLND